MWRSLLALPFTFVSPCAHAQPCEGTWSPLGSGLTRADGQPGSVIHVIFDGGGGPALFAAGLADLAGGVPVEGFAQWNGQSWSAPPAGGFSGSLLDGGDPYVLAMRVFDDGSGPSLFVTGRFSQAGGVPAFSAAKLSLCSVCSPDLDGNGTLDLFDFLAFVNLFSTADPTADCDHSGALNLFDFLCFTNAFNAGC